MTHRDVWELLAVLAAMAGCWLVLALWSAGR